MINPLPSYAQASHYWENELMEIQTDLAHIATVENYLKFMLKLSQVVTHPHFKPIFVLNEKIRERCMDFTTSLPNPANPKPEKPQKIYARFLELKNSL